MLQNMCYLFHAVRYCWETRNMYSEKQCKYFELLTCHLTDLHTFLNVIVIYRSALICISLSDDEWPPWSAGIQFKSYQFSESLLLQGYMEAFLPRCVTYTKLVGLSIRSTYYFSTLIWTRKKYSSAKPAIHHKDRLTQQQN